MLKITLCFFVLASTALSFTLIQQKSKYCYSKDEDPYKLLATKTNYDLIRGNEDYTDNLPECKPVQFWSLNRHGTRLPGKKTIKNLETLTKIQNKIIKNKPDDLCDKDMKLFKNWSWNNSITVDVASYLTVQGWNELRNIGKRNLKHFPELLGTNYSEKDHLFRYTRTERTESSFKAYAQGLFGNYENIHAISVENDTLIKAYKYCKLWQETVADDNPDTYKEYNKFKETKKYEELIEDVSERLGFKDTLDSELIDQFYDMCRFQQAWFPDKKSAWCAAFKEKHLQLLEYAEDLMYYYYDGHGRELNKHVGCMPLTDMMQRFQNVIDGSSTEPKSVHYFSHSTALQLLMTTMGMNKDEIPLTADNRKDQQDRLFRTSFIIPFAANINAVLYKCTEGVEHRVEFYLNEYKYEFPGCPNGVCSWDYTKEKFLKIAENCNLDVCKND